VPLASFATANDRAVEETARGSFNFRRVLAQQVSIEARNGVVTLTGTVEDEAAVALALATIEDLPGITRIDNQLTVRSPFAAKTDPWIARQIYLRLLVKAKVSASNTVIVVQDGVVTLTGTTETAVQRRLTEAYAKDFDYVKSVINELTVVSPSINDLVVREIVDDASITAQIKSALFTDRPSSASKAAVVTKNGIVAVTGEAASDEERAFITKLIESVLGVRSVTNRMIVRA
jgi:hyperosmotically inducible protein